jgi:hypothetical protein
LVGCAKSLPDSNAGNQQSEVSDTTKQQHAQNFQEKLSKLRSNSKAVGKADFLGISGPCDILNKYFKRDNGQYVTPKIGMI